MQKYELSLGVICYEFPCTRKCKPAKESGKVLKGFLKNITQRKQVNWRNLKCKFNQQKVHKIKKKKLTLPS